MQTWAKRGVRAALVTGGVLAVGTTMAAAEGASPAERTSDRPAGSPGAGDHWSAERGERALPALDVDDRVAVAVPDSPKPPPERISLTFAAIERSRAIYFVVSGEEKADAVARALAEEGTVHATPARGVTGGPDTDVTWFLDRPAASRL